MGVAQSAVFAQTAHNDGDAGEEEHQADDDASHHQRGHQQAGFITPFLAVWVLMSMTALVWAHWMEDMVEPEMGCVGVWENEEDGKMTWEKERKK